MRTSEKITKEAKLITDSAKDLLSKNFLNATKNGTLQINENDLLKIINIINLSVDDAYQLSSKTYQKTVARIIEE